MSESIEAPQLPGIYSITNTVTGKKYVGSTNNLYKRLNSHRTSLLAGNSENKALQSDYDKFGRSAFAFTVIECFDGSDYELAEREQYFVSQAHQSEDGCYNREVTPARNGVIKRICKICTAPHYALGYCSRHWVAYRKGREFRP